MKRSAAPTTATSPAKKFSRRSFLRHLALGATLAPLGWWERVKAFPGYLGFFKKKVVAIAGPQKTLFAWGVNKTGQLGYPFSQNLQLQIGTATNWSSITGPAFYSTQPTYLALRGNTLWAWGANSTGALGLSDTVPRYSPVQVGALSTWARVSLGYDGTAAAAVKTDGTLWTWGLNSWGGLGLGHRTDISTPTQVGGLTNWSQVSLGNAMLAAVKTDGTLWTSGYNTFGSLGDLTRTHRSSPVQVSGTGWSAVTAGDNFCVAVKTNGTLWAWGYTTDGMQGNGINYTQISSPVQVGALTNWSKVTMGTRHVLAVKTDGTLWSWGSNYDGQLGLGHTSSVYTPTQVGGLTTWAEVAAVNNWSLARKTDGTIWFFGTYYASNYWTTVTRVSSPIQVGSSTNWSSIKIGVLGGVTSDGKAWFWQGDYAYAADPGICNWAELSPVQLGSSGDWQSVAADIQSIGVKANGTLWAWGYNNHGQLGLSDLIARSSPVQVGALTNWLKASVTSARSAALKTDGTIWMWGSNDLGALGNGTSISNSSPMQVGSDSWWSDIKISSYASLALKNDGTLWGWGGYDGYGYDYTYDADGDGDGSNDGYDVVIEHYPCSSPMQLGVETWTQIAGTDDTHFLIKSDGSLWAWGNNQGLIIPDGPNYFYVAFADRVKIGAQTWAQVSANSHILAIRSDGTLWAWGSNNGGQLGLGNILYYNSPVQVGADNNWSKVHCGDVFSLGLKTDGTLWAWGSNTEGQLGNPNLKRTYFSSPVQIGSGTNWTALCASNLASMALK